MVEFSLNSQDRFLYGQIVVCVSGVFVVVVVVVVVVVLIRTSLPRNLVVSSRRVLRIDFYMVRLLCMCMSQVLLF